jgi:hypothetical protein
MSSVLRAIDVGQQLLDMKGKLDHGKFNHWIEKYYNFSLTTAARYMKIAWNRELFENMPSTELAQLSILDAVIILKRKGQYHVPLQRQINERSRGPADLEV